MKAFQDATGIKRLTLSWFLLLLLTLVAVVLSQLNIHAHLLILLALILTIIKSSIVIDRFMGLKKVQMRWRGLMLGYGIIIPAILLIIYLTA